VPDYIFCTNDEMALGAVDALRIADIGNDGSVVVVGVDGTPEAKALIDSQNNSVVCHRSPGFLRDGRDSH
jgi:ABC-type sugar transport system substrate-binding protein